jgi:uncharacterized SAM-binding protein YcdF (DUF218 family)
MWEVTSAQVHDAEAHRLLEQGWEPFAVVNDNTGAWRTWMYFRRQAPAPSSAPSAYDDKV